MARDSPGRGPDSVLRRIDPFCWIAAIALVLVALLLLGFGAHYIQWPLIGIALLLPVFDSWANRPR
jgi:sensor histidine kinase YesM